MQCYCPYQSSIQISGVTPDRGLDTFIFVGNNVFCSRSKITNGVFYSVLHYIGPAADAAKYRCKVEFFKKENSDSLAVIRVCVHQTNQNCRLPYIHISVTYMDTAVL
jgi:hypothetical protein